MRHVVFQFEIRYCSRKIGNLLCRLLRRGFDNKWDDYAVEDELDLEPNKKALIQGVLSVERMTYDAADVYYCWIV